MKFDLKAARNRLEADVEGKRPPVKCEKTSLKRAIAMQDLALALRSLERKGLIVASLDLDGEVRWHVPEKSRHVKDSGEIDRLEFDQ